MRSLSEYSRLTQRLLIMSNWHQTHQTLSYCTCYPWLCQKERAAGTRCEGCVHPKPPRHFSLTHFLFLTVIAGWKKIITSKDKSYCKWFLLLADREHGCVSNPNIRTDLNVASLFIEREMKEKPLQKMWIKHYCLVMFSCQATTPACISTVPMTLWMERTRENYGIVRLGI